MPKRDLEQPAGRDHEEEDAVEEQGSFQKAKAEDIAARTILKPRSKVSQQQTQQVELPKVTLGGGGFQRPADQWQCNTCLTFNKKEQSKCPCCDAPNPNTSTDSKPAASAPAFSFTTTTTTSAPSFSFTTTTASAPAFSFTSTTASAPTFSFSNSSTTTSSTPAFSFSTSASNSFAFPTTSSSTTGFKFAGGTFASFSATASASASSPSKESADKKEEKEDQEENEAEESPENEQSNWAASVTTSHSHLFENAKPIESNDSEDTVHHTMECMLYAFVDSGDGSGKKQYSARGKGELKFNTYSDATGKTLARLVMTICL
jgi:hypothetical protein